MVMSRLQRHPQRTQASSQQELAIIHQGQASSQQELALEITHQGQAVTH